MSDKPEMPKEAVAFLRRDMRVKAICVIRDKLRLPLREAIRFLEEWERTRP